MRARQGQGQGDCSRTTHPDRLKATTTHGLDAHSCPATMRDSSDTETSGAEAMAETGGTRAITALAAMASRWPRLSRLFAPSRSRWRFPPAPEDLRVEDQQACGHRLLHELSAFQRWGGFVACGRIVAPVARARPARARGRADMRL